jgi:hypothetical protein
MSVSVKVGRSGNGKLAAGRMTRAVSLAGAGRVAAVVVFAALAAGCSSSSSSSTSSSTTAPSSGASSSSSTSVTTSPSSSATTAAAAAACATSALKIAQGSPNGYAGGVDVTISFTNTSSAACTLYGYPGVSLVSSSQAQIGLSAKRVTSVPVTLVTLAAGATASASVQIADALNYPASTCVPVKAAYLRIFPPNQTASVFLANTSQTCSKSVQTLLVTAVQAGSGSA